MFLVGERVVYPMYGAGMIAEIKESEILGEKKSYYVLKIPYRDIKIMVPVENSERIGIRSIVAPEEIPRVIRTLKEASSAMSANWNRRYRENTEKLKSGRLEQVAEVVRNLLRADRIRKLSAGEKKMLTDARQILVSELIVAGGIEADAAQAMIDETV